MSWHIIICARRLDIITPLSLPWILVTSLIIFFPHLPPPRPPSAMPPPTPTLDPQPLADAPPQVQRLVRAARCLYEETYFDVSEPVCAAAPGRVNLIGEHTDYTGGYVLPMAIGYSTVAYGKGGVVDLPPSPPAGGGGGGGSGSGNGSGAGGEAPAHAHAQAAPVTPPPSGGGGAAGKCCVASTQKGSGGVVRFFARPGAMAALEAREKAWANYILGVVAQYLPDLPPGKTLAFDLAVAGDVPLGSGLSSSASLEVAAATFLERLIDRELGEGTAYSSAGTVAAAATAEDRAAARRVERALRCQRAENWYCGSPCGIMDQFVASAGRAGAALLIDCRSGTSVPAILGEGEEVPAIVVANSAVTHSIGGGEYPKRVRQCEEATEALRNHRWAITDLIAGKIRTLRDVTPSQVEAVRGSMDEVAHRRARHVTTENERTVAAKEALDAGDWEEVGRLMDASHASMRDDYEVSCDEIDALVDLAQGFDGVYGSRLTGGGFGGCTVTLVARDRAQALMDHLRAGYKDKTGIDCVCFVTGPCAGAREIKL